MKKQGFKSIVSGLALAAALVSAAPARAQQVEYIQNQGWMKSLPQMLYVIDACIGQSGDRSAIVTKAWFVNPKQAAVRIESDEGWRGQCLIDRKSRQMVNFTKLSPNDKMADEYQPAFIRRGQKTVEQRRPGLIRVQGYQGEPLGWAFVPTKS